MDSSNQEQQQETAPDVPATAPDLTVTKSQQMADEFLKSLAALSATIPIPANAQALLGPAKRDTRVSRGFLAAGIAAAAEVPELQAATRFDVDAAREALQFIDAWSPVLPSVQAFTRLLSLALALRKSPLTMQVRAAYAVANGLAKATPDAPVAIHAKAMKTAAKFNTGRKKGTTA